MTSNHVSPYLEIAGRRVAPDAPPFIVAELSANHGGDLDRALRIIKMAAEAGADAVKFQAYTADSLTLDSARAEFTISGDSLWKGRRLYDLYREAATPYAWFPELFAACRAHGVTPFASPFDRAAITMLEDLNAPAYKIASFEAVDLDLITACAETGKPLIISVGLCTPDEIEDAVAAAHRAGNQEIILLQCTSVYPANADEADLLTIPALAERFGVLVGYSDHTLGTVSSAAACALGACLIEKHVIDTREPPTADSAFSLLGPDLAALVAGCREAWLARGTVRDGPSASEQDSLVYRRSLYVTAAVAAGDVFTRENVRSIRPGLGLKPKYLADVLGKRASRAIDPGEPLTWDMILETNAS